MDDETQHTWRPVFVGQIRGDGQFDLVWSSEKPVRPIPYPSSRSHAEWDAFLEDLHRNLGRLGKPRFRRRAREQANGHVQFPRLKRDAFSTAAVVWLRHSIKVIHSIFQFVQVRSAMKLRSGSFPLSGSASPPSW